MPPREHQQERTERVRSDRQGVEVHRSSDFANGILMPRLSGQVRRIVQASRRQGRIEIEGAKKLPLRGRSVPVVHQMNVAQRGVCLGECLVQPYRGTGSAFCFGHGLTRVDVEASQLGVGLGKAGVRRGVCRIRGDGDLEKVHGLPKAFLGSPGSVVPGQQDLPVYCRNPPTHSRNAASPAVSG